MTDHQFLRPHDAAEIVKLSTSTLAKMRMRGDGPVYIKAGPKIVLYKVTDLFDWLSTRSRISTSE